MGKKVKLRKDEGGYALALVLILLILVGLIIGPLLLLMTTSLMSAQRHEEGMLGFYAADAGIEDAAYKIQHNDPNLPQNADDEPLIYTMEDVNGSEVRVRVEKLWILEGFEIESEHQGQTPHDALVTVGHTAESGTYQIDIVYDGSLDDVWLDRIGVWLPSGFEYIPGSITTAITTLTEAIDDTVDVIPVTSTALFPSQGVLYIDSEEIQYTDKTDTTFEDCTIAASHFSGAIVSGTLVTPTPAEEPYRDGTAYVWDIDPKVNINVGDPTPEVPIVHTISFQFIPSDEEPTWAFSWTRTIRMDIYLSWDLTYGVYMVTATAQDEDTGKETMVTSYIIGPEPFGIVTYTYE